MVKVISGSKNVLPAMMRNDGYVNMRIAVPYYLVHAIDVPT